MTVLVCGGRDFRNETLLREVLNQRDAQRGPFGQLIEGGARGVDEMARHWAWSKRIPVKTYKANWTKHNRAAGPIRNQQMLDEGKPDLVIAFPGGKGTADMVTRARAAGIPVEEIGLNMKLDHERQAEGR